MTRRHRTRTTQYGAALLAAALLAGCSGDDDPVVTTDSTQATEEADEEGVTATDDGAGESAAPPDDAETTTGGDESAETGAPEDGAGTVTSNDGAFSFDVPAGWMDARSMVAEEVEAAVRANEPADEFYTNLVITGEPAFEDLEETLESSAEDLAGDDGSYEMLDPVEVAGEEALGYVIFREQNDFGLAQIQRWVVHDDVLYVLTLSAAESQREEGEEILTQILDSVEWQD